MSERKYYVLCGANCKFESMTKEQIIAAIEQAVSTGEIKDIDAGFITKVKEQNAGKNLVFWVGTTAEYNAIPEDERLAECLYIKTDDTFETDVVNMLLEFEERLNESLPKIPPQAEITVNEKRGGQITCADEYGNIIKHSKRSGTTWVFNVPKYGTYTIKGVYNNITRTTTVAVDAVKQYLTSIEFYDDNFSNNDIETIVEVIQNKGVPETWNVGDIASTDIGEIQIIGKNHDEDTNGAKTNITFAIIKSVGYMTSLNEVSNARGWGNSIARKTKALEHLETFPENIKDAIRTVKKYTSVGNKSTNIEMTEDKLFLLSEVEIMGVASQSIEGEGTQYELFKNGNTIGLTQSFLWLRSPYKEDKFSYLVYQNKNGTGVTNYQSNQTSLSGVWGFCL